MQFVATRAAGPLRGELRVPGDKSLSHRAVLFSALAEGTSRLSGVLDSADVRSTVDAVRALGAIVAERDAGVSARALDVVGWGERGPRAPQHAIDCGNSGTTARLLLGVLAGWPITTVLEGDASLSRRPMERVTTPLEQMGASFLTRDGRLPVTVRGGRLRGIDYESPVASAQVKSAILLAGLRADGRTTVREPSASRDHTERLLPAFGVHIGRDERTHAAWVEGPRILRAHDFVVPADPSSAAFLVVAALLVPGSEVALPEVALNPTRSGFLRVLERMGADVSIMPVARSAAVGAEEPVGTVVARSGAALHATTISPAEVPSLVDEVPILALAATQADGTTRFDGIGELRLKESDRLSAIAEGLAALGASVRCGEDWLEISGRTPLHGASLDSLGDHRLAMTWAVGGLIAEGAITIERFDAVGVSYPAFADDLARMSGVRPDYPAS